MVLTTAYIVLFLQVVVNANHQPLESISTGGGQCEPPLEISPLYRSWPVSKIFKSRRRQFYSKWRRQRCQNLSPPPFSSATSRGKLAGVTSLLLRVGRVRLHARGGWCGRQRARWPQLEGGGRERGSRSSPAATASAAGRREAGSRLGAGRHGESSEAAGAAASGPPGGWCSPEAAAAAALRPVERARERGRGRGRGLFFYFSYFLFFLYDVYDIYDV